MEDWRRHLIEERAELGDRIVKLASFLSQGAPGATDIDRSLMRRQRSAMLDYADALDDRIRLFPLSAEPVGA